MLLKNLLQEYLLELQLKNYSKRTIVSVKNNNSLFFSYLENQFKISKLEDLSHTHIKSYIKYKQQLGLKPTYLNSIIKNMRMFFNYLMQEEYLSSNYIKKISWQKEDRVIINTFTNNEVDKMMSVYSYDTYLHARNKCILAILFDTGVRNQELCDIQTIDIKSNAILIHGKGNKERLVPISPNLAKIMLKYEQKRNIYVKERYQKEYYFLSQKGKQLTIGTIENILKECGRVANVSEEIRCSPHTCRHTYAQMQLKNGLDVYSLSRVLGHEDISITKRYLQSIQDAEVLNIATKTSPLMNLKGVK